MEKGKDKRVMKKKKRGTGWKQRGEKRRFMCQTWKTKAGGVPGETTKRTIWVIGGREEWGDEKFATRKDEKKGEEKETTEEGRR